MLEARFALLTEGRHPLFLISGVEQRGELLRLAPDAELQSARVFDVVVVAERDVQVAELAQGHGRIHRATGR